MSPRLVELLREYWLLTAEFEGFDGVAEEQKIARIRLVEEEIGKIARAENRCTSCLSDLSGMDSAKVAESLCGNCIGEPTH
jgi:hypothetical protein